MENIDKKMRDNAIAEWLTLLRNPETKKAVGVLADACKPDHRCCLGHLCHVVGIEPLENEMPDGDHPVLLFFGEDFKLPAEVQDLVGMSALGEFKEPVKFVREDGREQEYANLAAMNDCPVRRWTLPEIADVIETQLLAKNFQTPRWDEEYHGS